MKFVVRKDVFDVVEVKLHWETTQKLKTAAVWTSVALVGLGIGYLRYKTTHQN